jgi:hypothetical protein
MFDHKLDRLEKEVGSLSVGQQELHKKLQREMRSGQEMMRKHMDEMFATMNTCLDYIAASVRDQGGGSSSHNKGGKFQGFRHEQGGSTIPKVEEEEKKRRLFEAQHVPHFQSTGRTQHHKINLLFHRHHFPDLEHP